MRLLLRKSRMRNGWQRQRQRVITSSVPRRYPRLSLGEAARRMGQAQRQERDRRLRREGKADGEKRRSSMRLRRERKWSDEERS